MTNKNSVAANKGYVIGVLMLTFALPVVCAYVESLINKEHQFSVALLSKWFIFSAVGLRLLIAGIKQITNPAFTVKQIFNIDSPESFPIMREVGFANLCFGLVGIFSIFFPAWRVVSAFASGGYYGLAGMLHLFQRSAGVNEKFAMITDLIIFGLLAGYFILTV